MFRYKTVLSEGRAEQTIERSRFITHVRPVACREEAEAFFAVIRAAHRDATHNVPAMVLGDRFQIQWASDDGEPAGTSGAPIVQMLVKEEVTDVALVITRYFGGVKLGTGGLVRAYTGSAKLGLEAAGLCGVKEMEIMTMQIAYTFLSKIQNAATGGLMELSGLKYGEDVTMDVAVSPDRIVEIQRIFADLTGGAAKQLCSRKDLVKIAL